VYRYSLLLLSYFVDKGETSASVVQGVGVCATGALLFQMCLAGHIPPVVGLCTLNQVDP
jgi:hypothetical protein